MPINWSYLSGFLDGEGSLTITFHKRETGRIRLVTRIDIYNSNQNIIEEITKFLKKFKIDSKTYKRQLKSSWKIIYSLKIIRLQDQLRTLNFLKNLIIKKKQKEILEEFLTSRLENKNQRTKYSEKEFKLAREIQELNKRGFNNANL